MKKYVLGASLMIPLMGYGMSFQEVSERAYRVSGEMIESSGKAQAVAYERASVMAAEPLSLEGSARRIKADDAVDEGMEYGVMVGFSMKTPGVKKAQHRQFDLRAKMVAYETARAQGLIQVGLKRDWLLFELSTEKVKIFADKKKFSQNAYEAASKKYRAGRMSQMELLRQESEWRNAEEEHALAVMESEHAQLRLQEATLLKEGVVVDDLFFAFIDKDDQSENKILEAPSVAVLRIREEEVDAQIDLLRRSRVESVSMGIGMTQEPTQNSIDFKLTVPLVWSDKNEQKIAALMSERSALVARREAATAQLQLGVRAALEHLKERERRIEELRSAEKRYETLFVMAQKGFEGGVVTQFEYLATKNSYYDARLRSVGLMSDYVDEMGALEEKLGRIW